MWYNICNKSKTTVQQSILMLQHSLAKEFTMKKKILYFALIAIVTTVVVTCAFSVLPATYSEARNLKQFSRSIDSKMLSEQAYMGGSIIYNPVDPMNGHLVPNVAVAVRFGEVRKTIEENETAFDDNIDAEKLGLLKVKAIDKNHIDFSITIFDSNKEVSTANYSISEGSEADINSDGVMDISYKKPKISHEGFESAVYLNFLSSKEQLKTTMFAVLTEQYPDSTYPSGIIGINPDGKFLYSKYQAPSAGRSIVPSIVTGLSVGDYILDTTNATYVSATDVPKGNGPRSIYEDKIGISEPVDISEVLPLAVWTAARVPRTATPALAETYEDYVKQRNEIKLIFAQYKHLLNVPTQEIVDKINENERVKVETSIGLNGRFVITWSHIESDLLSAAYFSGEIDLPLKHKVVQNIKKIGPYKHNNTYTFAVGPIPITLECPGSFEMPIDVKLENESEDPFTIAITGLYGSGVDIGANVNWQKALRKGFITTFAKPYVITSGVFYSGTKGKITSNSGLALSLNATPKVKVKPTISVAKAVFTDLEASYLMPAQIGITAKEKGQLEGWVKLSHEGGVKWQIGLNLGVVNKTWEPVDYKIDKKEIASLNLFKVHP